jgi:hypothetical protein
MSISSKKHQEFVVVGRSHRFEHNLTVTMLPTRGLVPAYSLLLAGPTDALPGSPTKITVLAQRYAVGLPLWHPLDATNELATPNPPAANAYTTQRSCAGRQRQMWSSMVQVF